MGENSIAGKILQFIVFKLYGRKIYCSHIQEEVPQWKFNRRKTFRINCFHIGQKGRCVWVEIK